MAGITNKIMILVYGILCGLGIWLEPVIIKVISTGLILAVTYYTAVNYKKDGRTKEKGIIKKVV